MLLQRVGPNQWIQMTKHEEELADRLLEQMTSGSSWLFLVSVGKSLAVIHTLCVRVGLNDPWGISQLCSSMIL